MAEPSEVGRYFTRVSQDFDALYAESRMGPVARFINKRFRRDIYERFVRSVNHVRRYGLRTVLDVGCGPGRYAEALAGAGAERIVGVDCSPAMIELARRNAGGVREGICEFVCCDFMEFQTRERFDVGIAMGLFDYIADPLPFLARMRELTGHSVIASFPSISWYRTPIRKVRYRVKRCPVYFYKPRAIGTFASRAGFSGHEIIKIEGAGMDNFVTFFG